MKISFHGAAKEVTGSCHLVRSGKTNILVDCGLFQGGNGSKQANKREFGFQPADIDFLILTHAHLDHCGRIPLLQKQGFQGEIIGTGATRELSEVVMLDSAHLQEEDAKRQQKYGGTTHQPLYTKDDVHNTMGHFLRDVEYGKTVDLTNRARATFYDAGHILGSAFVSLEIDEGGTTKNIIFSGDLGNNGKPIVRDPVNPPNVNSPIVVSESTYGDRLHKPFEASVTEFYKAIKDTFDRNGNVFIPTFAIERAQELLFILSEGIAHGKLPRRMKIFLDSPMAISATEIFKRHPECYDTDIQRVLKSGKDPFEMPNLTYSRTVADSKAINDIKSGAVILAGSGMCNGGRILHHLKNNLPNENCSFIFVNYAPNDSLPRRIIEGTRPIRMFGEEVPVRAQLYTIGGFSAHADQKELLHWHEQIDSPDVTFLTHGDPKAMAALAKRLSANGNHPVIPELHQEFSF